MAFVGILPRVPTWKEELARNLGQGLSQGTATIAENLGKCKQEKETSKYFTNLKEEHAGDPRYELLSDVFSSPIAMEHKAAIAKNLLGSFDPYRTGQQERLTKDSVLKRYGSRIRELDETIKYGSFDEKEHARGLRKKLQSERDQLLDFESLHDEGMEPERGGLDAEDEDIAPARKIAKPRLQKFDAKNPKHRTRRDQILRKTGGDRRKAGIVLAKEFDL